MTYWSEGVMGDGAVILRDGQPIAVDQVVKHITELESALAAVVRDVNDYEATNNLHPNPGRAECWDSVARAKALLTLHDMAAEARRLNLVDCP